PFPVARTANCMPPRYVWAPRRPLDVTRSSAGDQERSQRRRLAFIDSGGHERAVLAIFGLQDAPTNVQSRKHVTAVVRHEQAEDDRGTREHVLDALQELLETLARARRDEDGTGDQPAQHEARVGVDEVRLVEDDDLRDVPRVDLADDVTNRRQLRARV